MNVPRILEELEAFFEAHDIEAAENYLTVQLKKAYEEPDYSACITILNEMIGIFRDTSQYEKSLDCSKQVLSLMQQLDYEGTLPYATTCLNVANALRAAGMHKESLAFYESILPIYQKELAPNDERFASFYNNLSLLHQEMGDFERAAACLRKALIIVTEGTDIIKVAITHSNLGASLLQLGETAQAISHLEQALAIFNQFEEKDFHYNAALAAMGQAYVAIGKLPAARDCYLEALYEQQKHCGKSEAFYRILDNLHVVEKRLGIPLTEEPETAHMSGLTLSEEFFLCIAKESLFARFGAYTDRMAIGLVGEGSECFGFDDAISADHDFGPGFCIWLPEEVYQEIGSALQSWYDALPTTYKGYIRQTVHGAGRVGVWSMEAFFKHFTGLSNASEASTEDVLYRFMDEHMAALFNGRIFYDPSGVFTKRRQAFYDLYTEHIWKQKIAASLILLGKYGQYNYLRAVKREDFVTAQMILYKYIEELLKLVHYVNYRFPPYYKWLRKSASMQDKLAVLADLTNALADFSAQKDVEKVSGTIEIIAGLILDTCRKDGLLTQVDLPPEELFLEAYGTNMMKKRPLAPLSDEEHLENNTKEELVAYMVSLEWQAFDDVQNQGGRADCQDDWNTFSIMRKSQYLAWPKELIISYIEDFRLANIQHWNLITEKYARMMQTTDPKAFAKIAGSLPALTEKQSRIVEQIVKIQIDWMEAFAKEYPHMASNSRVIHTYEDSPFETSYETYLRGELLTYSPETLKGYADFIISLVEKNQNLAKIIMNYTAMLYGYESLEQAEYALGYH